jgi:lipopolysaccharide/colanic/teichoic acid biosynthesis glycosyltransferase
VPNGLPQAVERPVAAAAVALLFLPVLVPVALAVVATSKGPVLYRQMRVGKGGAPFELLKFRTMRTGAGGPSVTAGGDGRVTPVGRVLRRTKLDELPQLINVMRGDMSFVGPRPEVQKFVDCWPGWAEPLLSVRPGITDPSSVAWVDEERHLSGRQDVEAYYVQTLMPLKLQASLAYVHTRTAWQDLAVLVSTAARLVRPKARRS